jgi:two-component system LytT family response regulator
VDYLLKPVRRARLRTALARARRVVASGRGGHGAGSAGEIVGSETPAGGVSRLLVDRGSHMEVASVDDIDWVEASDNHVIVHLRSERHRYRRTMEQVMDRLPADRFVRVHRSAIVNLDRVKQVHQWFHGTWLLVLANGAKIATGRHYREALAVRLNLFR